MADRRFVGRHTSVQGLATVGRYPAGMHPKRWRRSTHLAVGAAVLVAVVAVVAAALVFVGDRPTEALAAARPAPAAASPGVVPVPEDSEIPTEVGMSAALAAALADPNLGVLTGRISDALTGELLWRQADDLPMQPASTNKVLTAAAALLTLERDATVTTKVVAASDRGAADSRGVVVLVGGGDTTLSAAPADQQTWYKGAARISDLAAQVRASGYTPMAVQVDTSLYSGPGLAPGWDPADIDGGDIAPIEPVMLDGGRTQPTTFDSRRSPTPALDAAARWPSRSASTRPP